MLRSTLKNWLALLAKWAVKKHNIRLVVVSGWYGTEMSRELVYSVIGIKEKVRRINKNPWWDFSIPLAILGYKDEQRSFFAWVGLLAKSLLLLTFGKPNKHVLVLNLNYADADTVRYWSGFVCPEILLITNIKENNPLLQKMISNTVKNHGTIIYQSKDKGLLNGTLEKYDKVLSIASEGAADLLYKREPNQDLTFQYQDKKYHIRKDAMPGIKSEILAGCLAVAIVEEIKPLDALYAMVKYPVSSKMISRIKNDLLA